jgi:hypothetical protein
MNFYLALCPVVVRREATYSTCSAYVNAVVLAVGDEHVAELVHGDAGRLVELAVAAPPRAEHLVRAAADRGDVEDGEAEVAHHQPLPVHGQEAQFGGGRGAGAVRGRRRRVVGAPGRRGGGEVVRFVRRAVAGKEHDGAAPGVQREQPAARGQRQT